MPRPVLKPRRTTKPRTSATRIAMSRRKTMQYSDNAYFRPLVETATDIISIEDTHAIIRYISPSVEKILGYRPDQIVGRTGFDFVHPDDLAVARSAFEHRLNTPGIAREPAELRFRHCDGSWRFFEVIGNNCLTHSIISGIVVNLRDITLHKLAEVALQTSEARLRQITDNMLDVVSQVDLSGVHLYASPSFSKVLGYDPSAIVGTPIYDYAHPDDLLKIRRTIQTAIATRTGAFIEFRFRHQAGHYVWLETTGNFLFDQNGEPQGAVLAARDVTARRRRERELEAIAAVTASLRVAPARAEMIPVVLEHAQNLFQADGVAVALQEPLSDHCVIELGRGQFSAATGKHVQAGGVIDQVISSGGAQINLDSCRAADSEMLGAVKRLTCVPLSAQNQTIGALMVGREQPIADTELRLLTFIADIAANAIRRATLHEQTESRLQRLDALATINKAISSSLDLGVTLNILLDQVTLQLRVDAAAVLLFNPRTQTLQYLEGRGLRQTMARLRAPFGLSEDCAGRVVLERAPILSFELTQDNSGTFPIQRLAGEKFRAYLAIPLIAKGQVKGVLEIFHRAPLMLDPEWLEFLNTLARDAAIAIDNIELFQGLQQSNSNLLLSYDATLEGWSRALDLRDSVTEGHTQRVVGLTLQLARAVKIPEEEIPNMRRGALLHDIGKIGVPDAILRKKGALAGEEWEIMRKHPIYAYEMLSPIAYLRPALDIPYCHHEHWDGGGYPRGLHGQDIPLAARLFSIVDVWDALHSDRPYRQALPAEQVREYIHANSNILFDPALVPIFLNLVAHE